MDNPKKDMMKLPPRRKQTRMAAM